MRSFLTGREMSIGSEDHISTDGFGKTNFPFEGGPRRVAKAKRRRGMLVGLTESLPKSRTNIPRPR